MKICAIVLAAGASVRMGNVNKLVLPVPKETGVPHPKAELLIQKVVRTIVKTRASEVTIVTGFEADKIKQALREDPVRFAHNPEFETGMTSSIQAGIRNTPEDMDGYMICLADMPFLETEDYNLLLQAFEMNPDKPQRIVVPLVGNTTGNPVIFSASYKNAILKHQNPNGCKQILKANELHIIPVELINKQAFQDIDTATSYRNWILNERD